jgi:hypothetical protein
MKQDMCTYSLNLIKIFFYIWSGVASRSKVNENIVCKKFNFVEANTGFDTRRSIYLDTNLKALKL